MATPNSNVPTLKKCKDELVITMCLQSTRRIHHWKLGHVTLDSPLEVRPHHSGGLHLVAKQCNWCKEEIG